MIYLWRSSDDEKIALGKLELLGWGQEGEEAQEPQEEGACEPGGPGDALKEGPQEKLYSTKKQISKLQLRYKSHSWCSLRVLFCIKYLFRGGWAPPTIHFTRGCRED